MALFRRWKPGLQMRKGLIFAFWSYSPWAADSPGLSPSPSALTFSAQRSLLLPGAIGWPAVIGLQVPHNLCSALRPCQRDGDLPSSSLTSLTDLGRSEGVYSGGILNPNVWWELVNGFSKCLVKGKQTLLRLPFATSIWQTSEKFPYSCISFWPARQLPPWSVLARCISLPLTHLSSPSSKTFLPREPYQILWYVWSSPVMTLYGSLAVPGEPTAVLVIFVFLLRFCSTSSSRALLWLAPWLLHLVTCLWEDPLKLVIGTENTE